MKRIFIALILLLLVSSIAPAQPGYLYVSPRYETHYEGPCWGSPWGRWHRANNYFGFRLGLNVAHVRSSAAALDGNQFKTGVNIGLVAGFGLSHTTPLYFETGLYYAQKGGKCDVSGGNKFTYDLGYLELPLLLKYRHRVSRDVRIEPFAGAFVGVGVSGQIKNYGARKAFGSYETGYFRRGDAGIKLGCGIGFNVAYLDVSYDIGLANVGQDAFDDTHTGCLTINLGVNF